MVWDRACRSLNGFARRVRQLRQIQGATRIIVLSFANSTLRTLIPTSRILANHLSRDHVLPQVNIPTQPRMQDRDMPGLVAFAFPTYGSFLATISVKAASNMTTRRRQSGDVNMSLEIGNAIGSNMPRGYPSCMLLELLFRYMTYL